MNVPEFLLFNNPDGDIEVKVEFPKKGKIQPSLKSIFIKYEDVVKFFDPKTGWLYQEMSFDEHLYQIKEIRLDGKSKCINIKIVDRI